MMNAPLPVTRDNWRTHPHSVWAFQNMASLLPTRAVPRGDGPVLRIEEARADLDFLVFADPEGLPTTWLDFLARTHTDAVLVLHRGRLVYERYRNGMNVATPHMLFSVTKSLVGLVAAQLAVSDRIDLGLSAAAYVPELDGTAFGAATVRDLLDMRDGVPFGEDYADPGADIHLYSAHYWGDGKGGTERALMRLGTRAPTPGAFAYRTPAADVIGWVLRRATGQDLSRLLSAELWSRIGAERDALFVLDPAGHEIAGAGLNCTLRDLARFALHLRGNGLLSQDLLSDLLTGGDRGAFAASGQHRTRLGWSYRSFWWVRHKPAPALSALGVFGQRIFYEPTRDLIVLRFGSHPVASNAATDPIHDIAFAAVAIHLEQEAVT